MTSNWRHVDRYKRRYEALRQVWEEDKSMTSSRFPFQRMVRCPCNGEVGGCLEIRGLLDLEARFWDKLPDEGKVYLFHYPDDWIKEILENYANR